MASAPKQSAITRAVKAVEKAGYSVERVEIEDGKIIVVTKPLDGRPASNEWDSVR
jgi:hypothetical protein